MALYPGRTQERGIISPWAAEQRAVENNSNSLQRHTKDICKGPEEEAGQKPGHQTRERGYGMENTEETDPGESP